MLLKPTMRVPFTSSEPKRLEVSMIGIAQRLPHRAAPAEVEGAHHLLAGVGGRRAREPEGIGALDAREIDGEISHVVASSPVSGAAFQGSAARGPPAT
jgi:hypothetical protein